MSRDYLTKKQELLLKKSQLWSERESWLSRYQEITRYVLPFSGRYLSSSTNKGNKDFSKIYDETATFALDVMAAGMLAGVASPARPWFRLVTPDPGMMEYSPVKQWLNVVETIMRAVFAKSNTYGVLHQQFMELGAFGTAVTLVESNFENVIHLHPFTAGEYAIATNDLGEVDTVAREFEITVSQLVKKFVVMPDGSMDWTNVSTTVKNLWDTHKDAAWVTLNHLIYARPGHKDTGFAKDMPIASCYIELGDGDDKILRESGYRRFPCLAPRWSVRGGDVYGEAPSFKALGSIKSLQHEQYRKAQAIDYKSNPPLQVPIELQNSAKSFVPGGITYVANSAAGAAVRSAFEVNLDINALLNDIMDVRSRINRAFYVDLFLMISQDARATPATATEIAERREEKLLMIGPVLERLHAELLSPLIDITFDRLLEANVLPPAPPELQGIDLRVDFVSTLAQAQQLVGLGSMDRLLGTVGNLAAGSGDPTVWDKIDKDQAIDEYANVLGVKPSLVRPDDSVDIIRQQRAQAIAQQQRQAEIAQSASVAKDLSSANTGGDNALTDVMQQLQGYNANV